MLLTTGRRLLLVSLCGVLVSSGRPAFCGDALDQAIEAEMTRQQVPGLTLAVVRGGRIIRSGSYGYGSLEWKARTTGETRFEIASMSKMFTGAAARLLVEAGRLDPEAPVSDYLDATPESWRPMKVRHLVTMSTGLPEDWGADLIPYNADVVTAFDDASMVRAFGGLKPLAGVGAEFHYSSPGYHMLGLIVAKVAGQPLPQFLAEKIFTPAGMSHTSVIDNAAIVPERAEGYRRADGALRRGWYLGQYLHARADTGLLSTAEDLARWVIALRAGRIVKDPAALWRFPLSDTGRPLDYAWGWLDATLLGRHVVEHGGRYRTGFRSMLEVFPEDDLAVIVLVNGDWINVDRLALLVARQFIAIPDPCAEPPPRDDSPRTTEATIAALRAIAAGRIDPATTTADALEPLSLAEAAEFLGEVQEFSFAARQRPARPLTMHGHRLLDFTSLRLKTRQDTRIMTVYRDDHGKIAFIEPTE